MSAYLALLRGINVGGSKKVPMAELRRHLSDDGFGDVRTYIQSGNVVLSAPGTGEAELVSRLERLVERRFGFPVRVLVRIREDLAALLGANPFLAAQPDAAKLHVVFLTGPPDDDKVAALRASHTGPEELAVAGRDIYLHTPNGLGRAELTHGTIERALGIPATARNWRTVTRLTAMLADAEG